MARRERKKKDSGGGGGWLTTFSDLMSLLLTFFILLFSMSTVSEEKFSSVSQSLQDAFIGEAGGGTILDGDGPGEVNLDEERDEEKDAEETVTTRDTIPPEIIAMYDEALAFIEAQGLDSEVAVASDQDGIYLDIQESILFDMGQAELKDSGIETLDVITDLLNLTDNRIVVEGHTDDIPMNTPRFSSNWELSLSRGASVVRYLSETQNVDPKRLSAQGYGEYNPVVPNDSEENRAKNRRVNIVIVYEAKEGNE